MKVCKICHVVIPNYVKINGVLKNISARKYCLTCSPFGKHNTRKIHLQPNNSGYRKCPHCNLEKELSQFHNRKNKPGGSSYCKECVSIKTRERTFVLKRKCMEYKGNKCEICGYDKYYGALDFHHKDPSKKEFSISRLKSHAFGDIIKKELDKCMLLCANCHREIHAKF